MAYQQNNYPFKKVEWPKRKKKKNNQYKAKSQSGTRNKRKAGGMKPEAKGAIGFLTGLATAVGLTTYKGGLDSRTPGKWKNP